jgi:hypothetical protein
MPSIVCPAGTSAPAMRAGPATSAQATSSEKIRENDTKSGSDKRLGRVNSANNSNFLWIRCA